MLIERKNESLGSVDLSWCPSLNYYRMYSRVCLEPVELSMVPLFYKSRNLSECETLNNEKKVNRSLEVKDHNIVLLVFNNGLMGRLARTT